MIYRDRRELLEILVADLRPQAILAGWTFAVCVPAAAVAQLVTGSVDRAGVVFALAFTPAALVYAAGRYAEGVGWYLRSREEMLPVIVRLEQAIGMVDGPLQFFLRTMESTGRPPQDESQLDRMKKGTALLKEAVRDLGNLSTGRSPAVFLFEILLGGFESVKRLGLAFATAQRIVQAVAEAQKLIERFETSSGSGGSEPPPPVPVPMVASERQQSYSIAAEPVPAIRYAVYNFRERAREIADESATARALIESLVAKERAERQRGTSPEQHQTQAGGPAR